MFIKIRRVLSLIILMTSVSLIIWVSVPNQHQALTQSISSYEMQLPTSRQGSTPSLMASRRVVLEWPSAMRIGEEEEITLIFEPAENGTTSPSQQVEPSTIYDKFNIMAEARFEVAGIKVSPRNPTRESLPDGQTVRFKWKISTDQVGSYAGTVWLSLRYLPLDGSQAIQVPIYIHDVNILASSLFELNETMAYFLGAVGIILSMVIVFDDMIVLVKRWMKKNAAKDARVVK